MSKQLRLWACVAAVACTFTLQERIAAATAPALFGYGPQSTALAQSDLAAATPSSAAFTNPASASTPGTRVSIGYAHGWTQLELDGREMPYRDIAGTDLSVQLGRTFLERWQLGGAMAVHLPDRSLAKISFRPGTEPAFVRFDPSPQRATADLALALRFDAVSLGVGTSVMANAQGDVGFLLGQDGNGTYADAHTTVTLPYQLAPTAAASIDLDVAAIAVRYRGAQAIGLSLATRADVQVSGNPLNGTTTVDVAGQSGYVPATWDIGARWDVSRGIRLLTSLQLARWSEAPPAAAELSMAVQLGLTPGQLAAQFVRPALRDTLSPRLGIAVEPQALDHRLVLRAGYCWSPSPVPEQTGLVTYGDAPAHIGAVGAGVDLGRAWGVGLRADAALQVWSLRERSFDKENNALPFAHYRIGGRIVDASIAMEASWR